MKRDKFLKGRTRPLLVWTLALLGAVTVFAGTDKKPNIIYLMTDDQRWDNMGCYGRPEFETPHIDALADEGVVFDNAAYAVAICMPSRVTMLSGRYLSSHHVGFAAPTNYTLSASDFANTYPAKLKEAGYRNGFIGKVGFTATERPQRPSTTIPDGYAYKDYFGDVFDYFAGTETKPTQGVQMWPEDDAGLQDIYREGRPATERTLATGDAMLRFIDTQPADQPFCLTAFFYAVKHDSNSDMYGPHFDLFKNEVFPVPSNWVEGANEDLPQVVKDYARGYRLHIERTSTPEQYQSIVQRFATQGYSVDAQVGRLIEKLEEKGMLDNTIIIYSSDNGRFQGSHGLYDKALLYEESIKAPLIVWDGRAPEENRKRREPAMISSVDIAPTILSLAGIEAPDSMQGHDFTGILDQTQNMDEWQDAVYMEDRFLLSQIRGNDDSNANEVAAGKSYRARGVRTQRWKYFVYHEQTPVIEELYDLVADPEEENNLAADPDYADTLSELRDRTAAYYLEFAEPLPCDFQSSVEPPKNIEEGISYDYYEGSWDSLPNFGSLTPVASGLASSIDINVAKDADEFGYVFEGFIELPDDGEFTFYTNSDGGSALYIDGVMVVDNDGSHAVEEAMGTACLESGFHAISVRYVGKAGGNELTVSVDGPGLEMTTSLDLFAKTGVNIAVGKAVSQSTTAHDGVAERAVDGNLNGSFGGGSVTHTEIEMAPWWQLDLGSVESIGVVNLYNRTDGCCIHRLADFTVSALDAAGDEVASQFYEGVANPSASFDFRGVEAQFIKVELAINDALSLAEVEVYEYVDVDSDGDGTFDLLDTDDDNDGILDEDDAFPLDVAESLDTDGDGIGNNADLNDDGDAYSDENDAFPLDASEWVDTDSDGTGDNADTDDDGDGVADADDILPLDPSEWEDLDDDGIPDNSEVSGEFVNISTRAFVTDGSGIMIGGIVLEGTESMLVLIQAVGSELSDEPFRIEDTLSDTVISLFEGDVEIATNDNWDFESVAASDIADASALTGSFVLQNGGKSAALLVDLDPGAYTVLLKGKDGESGVALVEVYNVTAKMADAE